MVTMLAAKYWKKFNKIKSELLLPVEINQKSFFCFGFFSSSIISSDSLLSKISSEFSSILAVELLCNFDFSSDNFSQELSESILPIQSIEDTKEFLISRNRNLIYEKITRSGHYSKNSRSYTHGNDCWSNRIVITPSIEFYLQCYNNEA